MDIKRIRRANLLILLQSFSRGQLAKVADTSPAYISQLKSTRTKAFVGHGLARRLEKACGKPAGWMDKAHNNDDIEAIARALSMADNKVLAAVINLLIMLTPETEPILTGILGRVNENVATARASGALDESEKQGTVPRGRRARGAGR